MSKSKLPDDAELRRLYIDKNLSATTIAEMFGVWSQSVRLRLKAGGIFRPKPEITRDQLEQLFVNQRLSLEQVGKITGFSSRFVRSELKRHNIPIRTKYSFDHALLYRMYVIDGLLMSEIAEALGCSRGTIDKEIVRNGIIERHPTWARHQARFTFDQLHSLYVEQGLSPREIAERGGINEAKVRYWLKKYGIALRKRFMCPEGALRKLYLDDQLTVNAVSKQLDRSRDRILRSETPRDSITVET